MAPAEEVGVGVAMEGDAVVGSAVWAAAMEREAQLRLEQQQSTARAAATDRDMAARAAGIAQAARAAAAASAPAQAAQAARAAAAQVAAAAPATYADYLRMTSSSAAAPSVASPPSAAAPAPSPPPMTEYEKYIARRNGGAAGAAPAAPAPASVMHSGRAVPSSAAGARTALMEEDCLQGVDAACDQLTREEEAKQAWLAKLRAPASAPAPSASSAPAQPQQQQQQQQQARGGGLRDEFSQWGTSAADRRAQRQYAHYR